ncbi:hypothetical protein PEC18_19210 [Paucibacter sp. O1-1]|nr:hypothetical protein [Paucibacter sp. O1-1]MDA3827919.1 hypothetical protein [Paucibacter sp. O1-1]
MRTELGIRVFQCALVGTDLFVFCFERAVEPACRAVAAEQDGRNQSEGDHKANADATRQRLFAQAQPLHFVGEAEHLDALVGFGALVAGLEGCQLAARARAEQFFAQRQALAGEVQCDRCFAGGAGQLLACGHGVGQFRLDIGFTQGGD